MYVMTHFLVGFFQKKNKNTIVVILSNGTPHANAPANVGENTGDNLNTAHVTFQGTYMRLCSRDVANGIFVSVHSFFNKE